MGKYFLLLLIFVFSLSAQESDLKGIFVTSQAQDVLYEGRPNVKGVQLLHLDFPGTAEGMKNLLQPFLGQPLTKELAIEIKQKILLYYLAQKRPLTAVEFPEQKTAGNVVQILVINQQFGKPIYRGEIWYSSAQLNRYLAIEPGREIAEDTLQNNLSWMNRNPFQYSTVRYVPSDVPGVMDLEVTSKSRRVLRFYARAENSGTATTGYGRFATGFSWGNALWIGDLFSFEYSFSNEFSRYQSYMASYTSFLPWKHILLLFGNYATVKPLIESATVDAHSTQVFLHYVMPIKPLYTPFKQEVILGAEYKKTNSNVTVLSGGQIEAQLIGPPVIQNLNVTQAYGNYTLYDIVGNHNLSFSLDVYGSPASFLDHQSNADFNALRPNSKNRYFYTYLTFAEIYTLPKVMSVSFLLRGQISNDTLPPTELFCLGGYNTVRGYHECELSTDNGLVVNFELRTRPFQPSTKLKDQLIFLAFVDYGLGNNWFTSAQPGFAKPPHTQELIGVGPGMRYTINPYLQARVDYGFKLNHLFMSNGLERQLRLGFGQFHLGLLVSF